MSERDSAAALPQLLERYVNHCELLLSRENRGQLFKVEAVLAETALSIRDLLQGAMNDPGTPGRLRAPACTFLRVVESQIHRWEWTPLLEKHQYCSAHSLSEAVGRQEATELLGPISERDQ
jgi:hypothetical protein